VRDLIASAAGVQHNGASHDGYARPCNHVRTTVVDSVSSASTAERLDIGLDVDLGVDLGIGTVPIAIPARISTMAVTSDASIRSPSATVEQMTPTTGVARMPSEVVVAGRLRLTTAIAQ